MYYTDAVKGENSLSSTSFMCLSQREWGLLPFVHALLSSRDMFPALMHEIVKLLMTFSLHIGFP